MNKRQMWGLYQLAKTTAQRPSGIVEIEDAWASYQFDQAVTFVGLYIEGKLAEMDDKGNLVHEIGDLLGTSEERIKKSVGALKEVQGIQVEKR